MGKQMTQRRVSWRADHRREAAGSHYPFDRQKQLIVQIPQDFTRLTGATVKPT
jgi:hypothetical protein